MSNLYVPSANDRPLTERERTILRAIVHMFVRHASPVGSRVLSKQLERDLKLSAATIRNVMADLEELGYVTHPHTSAGRMPTDKGYRFYVDSLMELESLTPDETKRLNVLTTGPREQLFRDASKILGALSDHLAVVRIPKLRDIIVQRVDLIRLSTDKVLAILALDSDIVQTISIESPAIPADHTVEDVARYLNERLSGRPLRLIHEIFPEARQDATEAEPSLIRLFVERVGNLDDLQAGSSVHISGAQQLLQQPEFEDPERMRSVIELMENEDVIIHVVDRATTNPGVAVRIGNELEEEQLQDYSLVTTTYRVGTAHGSVSLIGPKRMRYSRMMSLVQIVSDTLHTSLDSGDTSYPKPDTDTSTPS